MSQVNQIFLHINLNCETPGSKLISTKSRRWKDMWKEKPWSLGQGELLTSRGALSGTERVKDPFFQPSLPTASSQFLGENPDSKEPLKPAASGKWTMYSGLKGVGPGLVSAVNSKHLACLRAHWVCGSRVYSLGKGSQGYDGEWQTLASLELVKLLGTVKACPVHTFSKCLWMLRY